LDDAPQPLNEHCVTPSPLAVHTDRDAFVGEHAGDGCSGQLPALIGVEDLRLAVAGESLFQRLDAERPLPSCSMAPRRRAAVEPVEHQCLTDKPRTMGCR
jgi:hypothetical protein